MSEEGHPAHKKTVVWLSTGTDDGVTKLHLQDFSSRKVRAFKKPIVQEKTIASPDEANAETKEPVAPPEEKEADSKIKPATKTELLEKTTLFTQAFIWSGDSLLKKTIQCLNNQDEEVRVVDLSTFKPKSGHQYHVKTDQAQYWAVEVQKSEYFLIIDLPKESELDFSQELTCLADVIRSSKFEPKRTVEQRIKEQLTLLISKSKEVQEIAEKGSENQKKAEQKPLATEKEAKKPKDFNYQKWRQELKTNNTSLIKLLENFSHKYKELRVEGPWQEKEYKKNTSKESEKNPKMIPLEEASFDYKLKKLLAESLTVKVEIKDKAPKYEDVDFRNYFVWHEIKAFSDVLNYDAGLLSQFFSNPLVRGGFLYKIKPSSLLDALTVKASEDEAQPELEYSDCLNLFLDYCVRSSQDCLVFFELLIFAITDAKDQFKLSLLDKEKLLGLLCDLFAEFRRPLLKELARGWSADFLKQLLAVFRQAIKQSTKAFDLVISKVFGTEATPLRKQFYESLYIGEGKLQSCHLYQRLLDDKTLDKLGKASLFERFLDDTSIYHHAQFLTLIDKSLETGVHLELLHNTLNQTLQKASKGKIPEAKNEDPFLRYCLKHLLGDSHATIITRFIKGLSAAKKEQTDDPKGQNKLKCVEDKNSILNNFYKVLTKFVTVDLPKDKIKADFLVEKDAFSDRQEFIKSLFGDFEKVFNQKVQKAAEALNEFREARKTIDSNTAYLKDRAYTKTELDRINNLESSFKNKTLAEIYSHDDYKNLKFLRSDYWKKLSPYLRLQATSEELDKLAGSCKSIYELTEKLTAYIDSTKAKFESFANPSKYNYKNSQLYFKTANKESDFKHYTTILKQMDVAIFLTTDILQNSCSFAAYRKIMKLTDVVVAIRDMPLMKRRSSIWVDKMVSIQEKFKNRAPETITLNEVQEFEGTESLLKEKLFRRLPDCLLQIAKSPKALEFIKNKEDQLIRSMRDDCESEDTDIVNKLEALNRSLKPITKPEELESIDDVLRLVHALDKKARDQISNWLDEVDSNATHLEYVFQKAQKGTHFQKTQVLSIMNSAKIIIQFSTKREAFEASAVAGLTHEVIGADEFVELFGLIKIIVSDSSEGPEVDPHNDHAKLQDFSRLGDTLKQLLSQVAWLRRCGLIDTRFTPPVMSKIADLSRGAVGFSQSSDAMEIEFNHSRNSLRMLKDLVENLAQVEKEITKCLTDDVQNWSLFTNFSGRKLYYLTQLLEGQVDEASDRRQIVNVITEANDVSEADVDALTRAHTRFRPAEQLEDYLRSVQEYMIKFTDDVVSNDLDVSKKDVLMMDLKQRAIKIASTGSHNSKLDKSNSSQLKTEINEFEAILKLLYASNQSAMISLSQLFYCSPELNIFDLIAFLQRALRDRFGRFYFIINADSMSEDTFSDFLAYSESIINHHASNYNLLVFMNERKRIEKLEQMEAFTLCTEDLSALIQKVERRSIVEKFADIFKKNQIVHSASAGMGKTKYISEKAAGSSLVDVFLAGEINEHTVTTRVGSIVEQIRAAKDLVVCLKLDFIEDFQSHARLVDFILFYTCFLCKIPTEKGCYPFGDKLKKIYIELGNTFVNTLLEKSAILRIMCWEECEEVLRPWKMVYHVAEFKLENISSLSFTNPEEQTAMKLLSITKKSQAKTVIASIESVSEADSHKLISEYFIKYQHCKKDIKSVTFAQYKFWIKMLALLGQEVDEIDELRPDMIKTPIKTVRVEIFNEIVYLASHLSNFTVEQARSSQEEMKKLVATMQSTGSIVSNVEKYKERFAKLKPWDCMNFILPMLNPAKQKFMLAMYKAGMLENPQDLFRCSNQRQSSETLVSEKKWYNTSYDKHVMFARMLATYLGEPENDVVERSTKYTLTGDNYMKICLMILKSKMKLPIVIMGESGCGKTELIEYVAKTLLRHPYRKITLYSGLPETSLLNTIEECVIEALKLPQGQDFWLFFDEFNTSSLQSLVCEIMIDRTCSVGSPILKKIPQNLVFLAACNPYRLKIKQADFGLVPKMVDSILSHRVYPIPERVMNFLWDFGQLSKEDEKGYINRMIKNATIIPEEKHQNCFMEAVFKAHSHVREVEEKSGVSLRDISRVIKVYSWFFSKLTFVLKTFPKNPADKTGELNEQKVVYKSIVLAISVCYGLRLNGRKEEPKTLLNSLKPILKDNSKFHSIKIDEIHNEISDFVDRYCFKELYRIPGIIPEDIAPNKPLKENFLSMLIAFDTRIPLIICGAPGTSKTLCTQILVAALNPEYRSHHNMPFFSQFKTIYSLHYGGSETSTAEGIQKVFHRAEKYLEKKGDDTPTIIFDEIGLAELSKHNPLKVLHPLLESPEKGISFIGMSNWTLDLSKMNRLILVSRPELTIEDLKSIFKKIIESFQSGGAAQTESGKKVNLCLDVLAETYIRYIDWQKKYGDHRHFHGSRDMYAVSKFILHRIQGKADIPIADVQLIIKIAIERNFNGTTYLFEADKTSAQSIPISSVPGLESEKLEDRLASIKFSDLNSLQSIDDFLIGKELSQKKKAVQLTSAGVFKRFYQDELQKKKLSQLVDRSTFLQDTKTVELIEQNIKEHNCRFLMLRSEGDLVDTVILARLKKIYKDDPHYKNKIIDWRGVENQDNQIELLSTLKNYVSLGYIVVMKNLDALYGSLYDLFNQKYMRMGNQQKCFLYYGESKQKVTVHPHFKCVVIQNNLTDASQEDIERKQPAPFLNRFEKFFVSISSMLNGEHIKSLIALRQEALAITGERSNSTVGMSIDMITSICVELEHLVTATGTDDYEVVELKQIGMIKVPSDQVIKFLQICTSDIFLNAGKLKTSQLGLIRKAHKIGDLESLLKDCQSKASCYRCVFTFSVPEQFQELKNKLEIYLEGYRLIDGEDLYRKSLQKRLNDIRELKGHIVLMIKNPNQVEHLGQLKLAISENKSLGRVIIIIHLERDLSKGIFFKMPNGFSGVDYWNGWDNLVIDELEGTPYHELFKVMKHTLAEVVGLQQENEDEENEDENEEEKKKGKKKIGNEIFHSVLKTCLQELSHLGQYSDLKNQIENLDKLFSSESHDYLLKALKKSLNFTSDELHKQTCGDILRLKSLDSNQCLNIAKELEKYFKSAAKGFIEKSLTSLFNHLGSLSSYAKIIMDSSVQENLRTKFAMELKDSITRWNPKTDKRSELSLELPFLRERYTSVVGKINELERSKDFHEILKQLIKDEKASYLDQSGSNTEAERILTNGQNILLGKIREASLETETIFRELGEYGVDDSDPILTRMILYDILKLTFFKQRKDGTTGKFLSTSKMFESFQKVMIAISSDDIRDTDFIRQLEIGVYLFTRSNLNNNELDLVADSLSFSESLLRDLERFRFKKEELNIPIKTEILIELFTEISLEGELSLDNLPLLCLRTPQKSHFADVMNYGLLLKAPFGTVYQKKAEELLKNCKDRRKIIGNKKCLHEIKRGVTGILSSAQIEGEAGELNLENRNRAISHLCLYFFVSARDWDLKFFEKDEADGLFASLTIQDTERICNSIVTAILDKTEEEILGSISTQAKFTTLCTAGIRSASELKVLGERLNDLSSCKKARVDILVCILIDRLTVLNQAQQMFDLSDEEGVLLLETAANALDWSRGLQDIMNILCIVVIRSALSKPFFETLNEGYAFRAALSDIIGRCPAPEDLVSRADRYLVVYFLQSLALYSNQSDISKWTMFNCVVDYNLHFKEAKAKKITIMDEEGVNFHNKLSSAVDSEFFSAQPTGAVLQLLQSQDATKLGNDYCKYIVACLFINRFINTESAEERRNLKLIEDSARRTIESLPFDELEKKMFRTIIEGNAFDYQRFMEEGENDQEFGELLKKLFYQHYAMVVCFRGKLGYNLAAYNQPGTTLSTEGFKANVMANADMENICGLLNQTITFRLGQLGFTPGQPVHGNLGMYRCSCGFFYGLADCGFAYVTYPCPRCQLPIGGTDHRHVPREGHIHIQTFAELSAMITQMFERALGSYTPHRIMIGSDPVLSPLKLREVPIMDLVNNSQNEVYGKNLGIKMLYRHLFDHFFLVTMQETLSPQAKINFNTAARQCINIQREDLRQMANRRIETLEQYFLAHIKNNIEVLRRDLSLRNTKEIFDWLRAAYSRSAYRISRSPQVSGETIQPENEKMLNPQRLLTDEQELSQKQNSSDIQGAKGIVMMLLNKRIPHNLLNKLEDREKNINFSQLYSVMRHNYQDRSDILTIFKDQVRNSSFKLLSTLVNYEDLLKEYSSIVMANFGLVRLIARKYNRRFTLDESKKVSLESLDDPEVQDEFEYFCETWQNVIPKFIEKYPDVFQFAFMCVQNFDAKAITDIILKEKMKTPVYRFLFIDRNDDDMEDSIYMKSVVTTLVKNLHNKLIDEAYKVLGVDPIAVARDSETSIRLDYCSSANLIGQVNYSSSVVKNYYFSTEMEHENRLVFDMANIEAECARKLIKQKILVDDNDLSFYRFKFSKKTESLRYLNQLKEKFKNIRLSESVKSELTRLSEEEKKSMKDFILEVAEPVLLGYYYDSPYMKLSNILSITKIARPLRMRIEDFVVMDLPAVYDFVLDSDFSSSFNTPLKTDQRDALGGVDFERLQRLESDMKESLEAYPDQQEMMKSYGVELQGIEVDDLPEALRSITFGQLGSLQKEIESRSLRSLRGRQEKMRKNTGGEMDSENM